MFRSLFKVKKRKRVTTEKPVPTEEPTKVPEEDVTKLGVEEAVATNEIGFETPAQG